MRVGLTGSFGSGKSTVARMFRRKGACVLSSDRLAHEVFRKGNPVYPKILRLFKLKNLTRAKTAEIVFRDAPQRRRLESLVHPYVFRRIREETAKKKRKVVVVEVPLLFESGFDRLCDRTVTVLADPKKILKRLARKGYSPPEIRARLRAQMPPGEKSRRSDEVIDNSGTLQKTRQQVERLWNQWSGIIKKN